MKLVLFQPTDGDGSRTSTAMLTQRGVVPVADIASIEQLIDQFESRRHELERLQPSLAGRTRGSLLHRLRRCMGGRTRLHHLLQRSRLQLPHRLETAASISVNVAFGCALRHSAISAQQLGSRPASLAGSALPHTGSCTAPATKSAGGAALCCSALCDTAAAGSILVRKQRRSAGTS